MKTVTISPQNNKEFFFFFFDKFKDVKVFVTHQTQNAMIPKMLHNKVNKIHVIHIGFITCLHSTINKVTLTKTSEFMVALQSKSMQKLHIESKPILNHLNKASN